MRFTSMCERSSDYYSAGILLAEMVIGKQFIRLYDERHIDMETVLLNQKCSSKLKNVLLRAFEFDSDQRYDTADEMLKAINKCPEFSYMQRSVRLHCKDGVVRGTDIKSNIIHNTIFLWENAESYKMKAIQPEEEMRGKTIIIGDAYFGVTKHNQLSGNFGENEQVYLIRRTTNERIGLDKPVFVIGKDPSKADYCIFDNSAVSRYHAAVIQKNALFYIIDYNSKNGTYINFKKILPHKEYSIKHGDQIRFANEEFWFNDH